MGSRGPQPWVTNFFDADLVLTYAKIGPDEEVPYNVSAFLVATDALEVEEDWGTLGAWSVKSPRGRLDDVRVPDSRRIDAVREAYVDRGRVNTGVNVPARGVGIARAALEDTVDYVTDREQYGQRVGEFQGVRWGRRDGRAGRHRPPARAPCRRPRGRGYTTERPVERYLRDARLLTIAGGPNDVHRNALADAVFEGYRDQE